MSVVLKGSSPAALTAGILLLSRARSFGQPLQVEILGDPDDITPVLGPALFHSPVLASCGVGRTLGAGALVIVPGAPTEPIATSLSQGGTDGWFLVDRSGDGLHPGSRAFVRLSRDPRLPVRELGRQLRQAMATLGCPSEPAILDLLFAAPVPPLVRLALALRAGRAMSSGHGVAVTRFLRGAGRTQPVPLPAPCDACALGEVRRSGQDQAFFDLLALGVRDRVEAWCDQLFQLGNDDTPEFMALLCGLVEVGADALALPRQGMLPPLMPEMDAVAVGLGAALGAVGAEPDAGRTLVQTFRFLGGGFTQEARHPMVLDGQPAPAGRLERWSWFCRESRQVADTVDELWARIIDPVQ